MQYVSKSVPLAALSMIMPAATTCKFLWQMRLQGQPVWQGLGSKCQFYSFPHEAN
jgi:hypothetical protein